MRNLATGVCAVASAANGSRRHAYIDAQNCHGAALDFWLAAAK